MKTIRLLLALMLLPFFAHAKLNVVATTPDFAALAQAVGGDEVEVTTLCKPTEDPHFVDAKPSFIMKLIKADAIIEGGAELEAGWLTPLLDGARNAKLAAGQPGHINCHEGVTLLEIPTTLDRSKGDIHAAGNPHFMTDPLNGKIVAAHLAAAFGQLAPKSAAVFQANLQKFNERLDAKMAEWQKLLTPFAGKTVVTYHNAWPYFAKRFDVKMNLFLEPKPGIPPGPAHLAEVVTRMKAEQIKVIIVEPYLNRKTAEAVSGHTGATVIDVAPFPGGVKGTEGGYIEWMDYLVHSIARGLGDGKGK